MKKLIVTALLIVAALGSVSAQKIATTFWNCAFGNASATVYETLKQQELEPIPTEDCIYLQNKDVYGITFGTIGMKFTADDAFYNIFGYNKFENKKEAENAYNDCLNKLREQYPNLQMMNKVAGCLKMYAYADAVSDEAFSIGLYKNDAGKFFVRLNVVSNYLLKRANKE